jgi:hypothetical protein
MKMLPTKEFAKNNPHLYKLTFISLYMLRLQFISWLHNKIK